MLRHCLLSMILPLLVACDSKPETVPSAQASAEMTGGVELEPVQTMEAGGQFHLLNKTSEQISFRATNESPDGFHPSDARLKCQTANSDEWEEGPRPMGDSETSNVEVAAGSQETLVIGWEPGLADYYSGGRCRVDLRLQDGSIIESGEFAF